MEKFEFPIFEVLSTPNDVIVTSGFDTDPDDVGGGSKPKPGGVDLPIDWFL